MSQLNDMLPDGGSFNIAPVQEFSKSFIESQPEEAVKLGCDPDYNAYTGELNPSPAQQVDFRTASGHVHIGWRDDNIDPLDPIHFAECQMVVKELDWALGVPSILYEPIISGKQRRNLYGKAGAFRPKSYGVEYRVLSNWWLKSDEAILWIYENSMAAMNNIKDKNQFLMHKYYVDASQHLINAPPNRAVILTYLNQDIYKYATL